MINLVGYVTTSPSPGVGYYGSAYTYVMARNGLFVESDNLFIHARVQIASATIRGLFEATPEVILKHGKIPQQLFELAVSVLLADPHVERYVGIVWDDGYRLYVPEQHSEKAKVEYIAAENTVVELHSHPGGCETFSAVDDGDEQGLKVYGVMAHLTSGLPSLNLRVGVYGHFMLVKWDEVFDGMLAADVIDLVVEGGSKDAGL